MCLSAAFQTRLNSSLRQSSTGGMHERPITSRIPSWFLPRCSAGQLDVARGRLPSQTDDISRRIPLVQGHEADHRHRVRESDSWYGNGGAEAAQCAMDASKWAAALDPDMRMVLRRPTGEQYQERRPRRTAGQDEAPDQMGEGPAPAGCGKLPMIRTRSAKGDRP